MRLLAILTLCLSVALGVQAQNYQMKKVEVLPIESYPLQQTIGAVTVAIDPYPTDEKSLTAFDVRNLNSKGYFPVHVIVQNSSPQKVTVRARNIVLVMPNGGRLYTTPATMLVEGVIKDGFSKSAQKAYSSDLTRKGSPLLDFTAKELTDREIESGSVSSGFLFFFTQEPKKNPFKGSYLHIPQIMDDVNRTPIGPFSIPLDAAKN